MTLQPKPEQLAALSFTERWIYRVADWCNRTLKQPFMLWNACFMYAIIWLGLSRRLNVSGLEHVKDLDQNSSVLIASNHRTFFDFFVVTWVNFDRSNLPRNIYFPVRSNFFYDNFIGLFLNFFMGGCAMFPPIFRDPSKKVFNAYSIERLIALLQNGSATVGFHPEGTRNKDPDPYSFLPARPGIGHVIEHCPNTNVIPVFIIGMSNRYIVEIYRNWFCAGQYPIWVCYGPPKKWKSGTDPHEIAEQTLEAIIDLSKEHQQRTANP